MHRYDEAIRALREALDIDPNYWLAHDSLGLAYQQKGQLSQAIAELQTAARIEDSYAQPLAELGAAYALAGKRNEAQKVLEQLKERSKRSHVSAYSFATIYAGLGEKDRAFEFLDKAYQERSFYITDLRGDPELDSLRSDPRFADLVRRVGLPP